MAKSRAWRETSGGEGSRQPAGRADERRKRVFKLAAGFLALLGVLAALIYYIIPSPEPYFVPICMTEYKSRHLPVNAFAIQDRQMLLREDGPFPNKTTNPFSSQERALLIQELKQLASRGENEPVVIYLSGFMLPQADGSLFILPADANPDQPATWHSFAELLRDVKNCPAKHKLLILDTMRPMVDARLGVLANDVASRVQTELKQVVDPNRLVLCSCSPGQVAWVSEPAQQSVFGFYLDEGLRGYADAYNPDQRRNFQVSAKELARFVQARVDRWARQNRGTRQTPMLLGDGEDFTLVSLRDDEAEPVREMPAAGKYPDWLQQEWQARDRYWEDGTFRLIPHAYRELETSLLRAEEQWRFGVDPKEIQNELAKQVRSFKALADQAKNTPAAPDPHSLALARQQRPTDLPDAKPLPKDGKKEEPPPRIDIQELRSLWNRLENLRADNPKEAPAEEKKLRKEFVDRFEKVHELDQAWEVFEALADDPSPGKLAFFYSVLREVQPRHRFVETVFLRRLNDLRAKTQTGREWPRQAILQAMQAVRRGEQANACDPRIFPWVRAVLDQTAQKRHDAEVQLFAFGSANMERANQEFRAVVQDYLTHNGSIAVLQDALLAYDEASVILPAVLPSLLRRSELAPHDRQSWDGSVEMVDEMYTFFSQPPKEKAPRDLLSAVNRLQQNTDTLRQHLESLQRRFTAELPDLIRQAGRLDIADPYVLLAAEEALASPMVKADQRARLWNATIQLARHLHEQTRQTDRKENDEGKVTDLLPPFEGRLEDEEEQQRTVWRARLAGDLLRMGGWDRKDIPQVKDEKQWPTAAQVLRTIAADELPDKLMGLAKSDVAAAARLSRVAAPFDQITILESVTSNPNAQLYRERAEEKWTWQGNRYHYTSQDYRGLNAAREASFYRVAGEDYLLRAGATADTQPLEFRVASSSSLNFRQKLSDRYQLALDGGDSKTVTRPVGVPTGWLKVNIVGGKFEGGAWILPIDIEYKPLGGGEDRIPADGFLVQAHAGGRHYHHHVRLIPPLAPTERVELLVSDTPQAPKTSLQSLELRPNQQQSIHLFVHNPSAKPRKVVAEIRAEGAPPAISLPLDVGAEETRRVIFGKPKPIPPDKAKDLPELSGKLRLVLRNAEGKREVLSEKELSVRVAAPSDYTRVSYTRFTPGQKNRLTVRVQAKGAIKGPPCRVRLVLPPDRIPSLARQPEKGNLAPELRENQEVELFAEDLQFKNDAPENGFFYVNVDGFDRAFVFRVTFVRSGTAVTPVPVLRRELRLQAPHFLPPDEACVIHIEADNAPPYAQLEIGLQQTKDGPITQRQIRPSARRERVGFTGVGPEGTLFFATSVSDWTVKVDMTGVLGTRYIRVRMLGGDDNEIVLAEQQHKVVIDATAPKNVRIVRIGNKPVSGGGKAIMVEPNPSLPVVAQAVDDESDVDKVLFYLGKPKDGKFEKGVPMREGMKGGDGTWQALIPADREGPTDLTVQVVNGVGLVTNSSSLLINVRKAGSGTNGGPSTGKIVGKVLEGTRPQPGLLVVLTDPNDKTGKPKDSTKTDAAGNFKFEKLKPGTYKVSSSKRATMRRGEATVVVTPGKTANAKITLLIQ